MMPTLTIHQGHSLSKLKEIASDSVHCICTSPPYWNLRAYKTEPQIWGGQPDCPHEWVDSSHQNRNTNGGWQQGAATGLEGGDPAGQQDQSEAKARLLKSDLCRVCGAWRGELGAEPSPQMFVEHLVMIFAECRRVLHPSGVLFVNIADSYAANRTYQVPDQKWCDVGNASGSHVPEGYKSKDLLLVPERLALAMQADGWWVRSRIAWCKKSPMPESVTDRPTSAWEHIWMFTKSDRYFWDKEAVAEKLEWPDGPWGGRTPRKGVDTNGGGQASTSGFSAYTAKGTRNMRNFWLLGPEPFSLQMCESCGAIYDRPEFGKLRRDLLSAAGRQLIQSGDKFLWQDDHSAATADDVATEITYCRCGQTDGWLSHYAAFPSEIPRRAILAATSARGVCAQCRAPYERVLEKMEGAPPSNWNNSRFDDGKNLVVHPDVQKRGSGQGNAPAAGGPKAKQLQEERELGGLGRLDGGRRAAEGSTFNNNPAKRLMSETKTVDWQPTCKCAGSEIMPATVLDVFGGTGTTGAIALELGRNAILIELNPSYVALIKQRCAVTPGLPLA